VIGDKYNIENRIGTEFTLDATAGERSFALKIDALLQSITVPDYRQLNIEAIESLVRLFRQNPDLYVKDDLILDVLIGHAVRVAWKNSHTGNYDEHRGQAWEAFYGLSPNQTDQAFIGAFMYLLAPQDAESELTT
jgi:phosphorylase kinase alpha/beta subunit